MNWFNKSKRTWKAAHAILKQRKCFAYVTAKGIEYRDEPIARWRRERQRNRIAHQLAEADGYKQHPDHYWHEARKAIIDLDRKAKEEWNNR